ncbi:YbaB/EbfC family nucleoid-associated protein [Saccharothrix yanglingensis]|nr:YbaB/EbfC family nucleoid-associated protein [Saccharothrix yanglingensis]
MPSSHTEQLDQLLTQFQEQQRAMVEIQRRLREIRVTATAPRKVVSVTVGHGGHVTDVKFPTAAYKKMPPAELAGVLVDTIADAQRKAADEAAALMAPQMPPGLDAKAMFSGELDVEAFTPPESGLPEPLRAVLRTEG